MPDLPTLTVTQAQADRMIAAWGTAAAYRQWLRSKIVEYVIDYETTQTDLAYKSQREADRAQARLELES